MAKRAETGVFQVKNGQWGYRFTLQIEGNRISESCTKKEEQSLDCPSQKSLDFGRFLFPEVALEEASECFSVSGFVAGSLTRPAALHARSGPDDTSILFCEKPLGRRSCFVYRSSTVLLFLPS